MYVYIYIYIIQAYCYDRIAYLKYVNVNLIKY